MKKFSIAMLCVVALGMTVTTKQAAAIQAFAKAFNAKYVEPSDSEPFKEAVKEAKCNVCHDPASKSKKDRNPYGNELSELLDAKADKENTDKINEALDKVAAMHSVKGDDKSPTFGDRIKEGKLPWAP